MRRKVMNSLLFKVVYEPRPNHFTSLSFPPFRLKYRLNRITHPQIGYLYCFFEWRAVKRFLNKIGFPYSVSILVGDGEEKGKPLYACRDPLYFGDFWNPAFLSTKRNVLKSLLEIAPEGTVTVSKFRPLFVIGV